MSTTKDGGKGGTAWGGGKRWFVWFIYEGLSDRLMAGWPTEPQALTDLSYIAVVSCQNHPRMISLALPLLLFSWLLIHFIHRFYTPANKSRGILPTSLTNQRQISTTITLRTLYLRIESTAFNFHHDALSHRLTRNPTARLSTALRVAFDLGIVISLLGMVVALALLSWTFMLLVRRLVVGMAPPSPDIHTHVKRTHQSDYIPHTSPARAPADIPVQLLVRANHTGAFMPPNVSYPLTRRYKRRSLESLSRSHIFRCSSAHYSSLKPYTKQGMQSLPHCPSSYFPCRPFADGLQQRWRTSAESRRILDVRIACGFRRVSFPCRRRAVPTRPRTYRRSWPPPQRVARPRLHAPTWAPVSPPRLFRHLHRRFDGGVRRT